MGIDPERLSCQRILLSSPPAASTPSKTDLPRDSRGQHVKLRKSWICGFDTSCPERSSSNPDPEYYLADCAEEVEVLPGHVDIIRSASAARRCRLAATSAVTVARSLS